MEHLKLSTLLSVTDESEWITNLLLVNQSYHILHHFNYMRRISSGSNDKFQKLQDRLEKDRLEILDQLMEIKNATVFNNKLNKESSIDYTDENQPKKRGPKPKIKIPSISDLTNREIQ